MSKIFYRFVWDLSEVTGIGLGRFAPYVFGMMVGVEGKKNERR